MANNYEELKWSLETYCRILYEDYIKAQTELEEADSEKFYSALERRGRSRTRLKGFCRAMEIVEEELHIKMNIPDRIFPED